MVNPPSSNLSSESNYYQNENSWQSSNRPACLTASVALIVGFGSWVFFPFLGGILAVILGHMARHQIKKNPILTGSTRAMLALILGYIHVAIYASVLVTLLFLPFMLRG